MSNPPLFFPLRFLICFLLTVFFPAKTVFAWGEWKTECERVEDHIGEDGKLQAGGDFTHFVCTTSPQGSTTSHTLSIFVTHEEINTVFIVHGQTPLPPNYNVIALANGATHQFAPVDQSAVQEVSEDVIETAIEQQISFASVESGNPDIPYAYRFKPADQELLEKIGKETEKQLNRFRRLEIKPGIKKKIPIAGYLADHWLQIRSLIESYKSYLILCFGLTPFISLLYSQAIKDSVITYEDEPASDFHNCLVRVLVDTNVFLRDMHDQGITQENFTSLNTIEEISRGFDSQIQTFWTIGEFIDFADQSPECRCPTCPGQPHPPPTSFSNCRVNITMQTNAMITDALRLTNSDFNNRLNAEIPLSGYFSEFNGTIERPANTLFNLTVNCSTTLNTESVLHARLNEFARAPDGQPSRCECPDCPNIPTQSSQNLGVILVGATSFAVAATLAAIVMALKYGGVGIYNRIKN